MNFTDKHPVVTPFRWFDFVIITDSPYSPAQVYLRVGTSLEQQDVSLSAESQKGINAVQWCSIENQKGTNAIGFEQWLHASGSQ